jgi:hypothetical protein
MSELTDISRLFAAERREQPPPEAASAGWHELTAALEANVSALPVAHGPLKVGLSVAVKWGVGSGIAALLFVGGGATLMRSPAAHSGTVAPVAVATVVVPRGALGPSDVAAPAPSSPANALMPESALSASPRPSTFAEELKIIKLAKQEQDAGRYHLAEVWLDEHEHQYPNGIFSSERSAMRVLLGCQQAQGGSLERARQFLARNPSSPLLDRISRACWPADERPSSPAAPVPQPTAAPVPVGSNSFPSL